MGIAVDGVFIYPVLNNTLMPASEKAEITNTGIHVGQGMALHWHADGFSATGNGLNLYNSPDYDGQTHPPLIGFGLDGIALYGKYDASYNISFLEIDCEVDVRTATRFKIESYPTILIFYNGETYNYDAKPDQANLIQFLDGSLPISGGSKKWWDVF